MSTPAPNRPSPKAPELGAFPLDHLRECKSEIAEYYRCLEAEEFLAPKCREFVTKYLTCRMERGLMAKQDMKKFGIPKTNFVETRAEQKTALSTSHRTGVTHVPVGVNNYNLQGNDGYEVE